MCSVSLSVVVPNAAPHMGMVWLAVTVGHVFSLAAGVYDGRPRYSAMLEPAAVEIDFSDSDPLKPGTTAWFSDQHYYRNN